MENVSIDSDIFDSVKDTLEYQVAESLADQLSAIYQVTFNTAEITFITIHLRGAKEGRMRLLPLYKQMIITKFHS